jgi:hypothetical protein
MRFRQVSSSEGRDRSINKQVKERGHGPLTFPRKQVIPPPGPPKQPLLWNIRSSRADRASRELWADDDLCLFRLVSATFHVVT